MIWIDGLKLNLQQHTEKSLSLKRASGWSEAGGSVEVCSRLVVQNSLAPRSVLSFVTKDSRLTWTVWTLQNVAVGQNQKYIPAI